jgi:tetratricopeptide (TPR) repeat protein
LYGYSLACTYAGDYAAAIRSGLAQSDFGRRFGNPYFIGRGDSSLSLPLYVIGLARPAAERARHSADAFRVRHRYHLGFIENVLGLALLELGDVEAARNNFEQARKSAAAEIQPRVEGLATFNLAWLNYVEGKLAEAEEFAQKAVEALGPSDRPAVDLLRKAMSAAIGKDREAEARFLLKLAREETSNLDLVRRATIAQRARAVVPPGTASEAEVVAYLTEANATFADIVNQLGQEVIDGL